MKEALEYMEGCAAVIVFLSLGDAEELGFLQEAGHLVRVLLAICDVQGLVGTVPGLVSLISMLAKNGALFQRMSAEAK